jgi:hypothetical protein
MSARKIYTSGDKELSSRISATGGLVLEITLADNTKAEIELEKSDAISFILELYRLKKTIVEKFFSKSK